MIKPKRLCPGDKVAIVSLSAGILGEPFAKHELDLGLARLKEFGLSPVIMNNALKGMKFLKEHPEARAADLKQAFADEEIKGIICAIGGNDTYKTLPYLLGDKEFTLMVKKNPKVFLGFSDSTVNHLMLNNLGLITFYGMALLTDFAEFEEDMLPYSKQAVNFLFDGERNHKITHSPIWYKDRTDFSPAAVGSKRESFPEKNGFISLGAKSVGRGALIGGCIDTLAAVMFNIREGEGYDLDDVKKVMQKFDITYKRQDFEHKVLLLETSEAKMSPETYRKIIKAFKKFGAFENLSGLILGKPIDEVYFDEYKQIISEELDDATFPILYNINIGHSYPHTILPLGALVEVDGNAKTLKILECPFED